MATRCGAAGEGFRVLGVRGGWSRRHGAARGGGEDWARHGTARMVAVSTERVRRRCGTAGGGKGVWMCGRVAAWIAAQGGGGKG